MKKIELLVIAVLMLCVPLVAQEKPVSHPDMMWNLKTDYSDEFNEGTLDVSKWNTDVRDWGTWSWEPSNAYVKDNALTLQMVQKEHTRKVSGADKKFYFTSGIAQISKEITYGYFETRIKASAKGQGTCPAFWLYSVGQPTPTEEGGVQYCEIDAIEIFQIANQLKRLEMNLHTRIIENGELTWKRPGQGNTELCHNSWDAPWDPRDEYHTYGVLNRPDSIFWYVDGIERGKKKNYYWHLPMHVTVSMGLRTPYEKYINGVRTVMEYPESSPEPGFPTEMYCDYVRVWEAPAQIIVDKNKYENSSFSLANGYLDFEYYFDAGSGFKVLADDWSGLTVKLVEKNEQDEIVNTVTSVDASIVNLSAGYSKVNIPLSGLTVTEELPTGHYYALIPTFKSSKGGGVDVTLTEELRDIKIVEKNVSVEDELALQNVVVYPNPATSVVFVQGVDAASYSVDLFDLNGIKHHSKDVVGLQECKIKINELPTGVYLASVRTGTAKKVLKFSKL
ncbi:family 16 glycosylhydrolase [Labilibacter marinus]|uniref:family 16 glycosylhydrolase n=1 Tax=Labilibacter marinus TaxID=1477105 RepID=UPI000833651B|nr:family 16 glycosylhydrolase [Labilibacter marinus]